MSSKVINLMTPWHDRMCINGCMYPLALTFKSFFFANMCTDINAVDLNGKGSWLTGAILVLWLVNSFTGNSVILRHSCYTTATLLIHCKPRFRSQQHIFQRKSLLACQIHWIVLQKHFPTTQKHVFCSIPQIGFAHKRVNAIFHCTYM